MRHPQLAAALVAGAAAIVSAPNLGAAEIDPTLPDPAPGSCDGRPAAFHAERAKEVAERAFSRSRWRDRTPARAREERAWRRHKRCVRLDGMRERVVEHRAAREEAFRRYRELRLQWGSCRAAAPAGSDSVRDCIRGGATEHDQSYSYLLAVASCESELNRLAANPSGASGLFQFMPSTWATTPYAGRSIWSARAQALAAAWAFRQGRAAEWECA